MRPLTAEGRAELESAIMSTVAVGEHGCSLLDLAGSLGVRNSWALSRLFRLEHDGYIVRVPWSQGALHGPCWVLGERA
jgi:hypothetical protein